MQRTWITAKQVESGIFNWCCFPMAITNRTNGILVRRNQSKNMENDDVEQFQFSYWWFFLIIELFTFYLSRNLRCHCVSELADTEIFY